MQPHVLTGIDVGTTKTVALCAQHTLEGTLEIVGVGHHPSTGLSKGLVIDLERTTEAIRQAVAAAERMAGVRIREAHLGVSGAHLRTHPTTATVPIMNPDRGVGREDVQRVLAKAKTRDFGPGRKLVATLVREYAVDGGPALRNAEGQLGARLEVRGLLVSGDTRCLENLHRAASAAGLEVAEMFLQPIASGEAVMRPEELEDGSLLIDIGGGTTDVAVYLDGAIAYTFIVPVGGDHFDSDIAYAFNLDLAQAEWLKREHARVSEAAFTSERVIELPDGGGAPRYVAQKLLAEVAQPRALELLELIAHQLEVTRLRPILAGTVVLTGGGSLLHGLDELAERRLGLATRRGVPSGLPGMREGLAHPSYATAVGLIRLAEEDYLARRVPAQPVGSTTGMLPALKSLVDQGTKMMRSINYAGRSPSE